MGEPARQAEPEDVGAAPQAPVGAGHGPPATEQREPCARGAAQPRSCDEPPRTRPPFDLHAEPGHRQRRRAGGRRGRRRRRRPGWRRGLGRGRRLGRRRRRLGARRDDHPPGHEGVDRAEVVVRSSGGELHPGRLAIAERAGVEAAGGARRRRVRKVPVVRPADGRSRRDGDRGRRERVILDRYCHVAGLARLDRRPGRTAAVAKSQPGGRSDGPYGRQGSRCLHLRTYGRRFRPVSRSQIGYISLVKRTAVELAADATRLDDPKSGLAAITELRQRLEELEARHVENAIRSGLSWSRIAEHLAVSKQAAHKKHARRVAEPGKESTDEARRAGRNVRLDA
jgi:hypothetical protein